MERRNGLIRANSDRLSSLPDDLLCHVLSFIPTKSSVATSILATRYRYLWRDVVNLDFDDHEYCYGKSQDREYSFSGAINRVMLLRSNSRDINTFRLIMKDKRFRKSLSSKHQQIDNWIRYAIAHNVQAVDIQLARYLLPRCLFTCRTLVYLSLHDYSYLPDDIFLPNLKKLHIYSCKHVIDGDFQEEEFQDLISGCPVLEELNIQHYQENDMAHFVISSPTIKWLTLNLERDEYDSNFAVYNLEIDTPALRYLNLRGNISQHISGGVFDSLVEASIYLNNDHVVDNSIYSKSALEFVERLCQVKCLIFLTGDAQFLDYSFFPVTSKFINITKLEWGADWPFLLKFLESADNLQVLTIRALDYNLECWTEPQQVPTCLSSNLREVTVDPFGRGPENEFEMVSYILKNGKVLNEMKISAKRLRTKVEKRNARRRILEFERGSHACKVKFS